MTVLRLLLAIAFALLAGGSAALLTAMLYLVTASLITLLGARWPIHGDAIPFFLMLLVFGVAAVFVFQRVIRKRGADAT